MVETGATVADAAAEWLRWAEHDRDCKPSTLADYRSTSRLIVRALGEFRLEDVTPQLLERWKSTIPGSNRNVWRRSRRRRSTRSCARWGRSRTERCSSRRR